MDDEDDNLAVAATVVLSALNDMDFNQIGQSIISRHSMTGRGSLRKIITIVVTRCHILKLKCTKFVFRLGLRLIPPGDLKALSRHRSWI